MALVIIMDCSFYASAHPCLSHLQFVPVSFMILFISLSPPLPLSLCLQPSRRPSLQPSLDCMSAPSHHDHCHPNQHFASQLSLCLGDPHPSSPCTFSHLPTPLFYSLSSQFSHSQLQSLPPQLTSYCSHSCSQHNTKIKLESEAHPCLSLQSHDSFSSSSHTSSDSLSAGSCFHKKNPLTNNHLLCSSRPNSKNSHSRPWHFTLHSQSSPNLSSLQHSMSNVCPLTLQDIQHKSDSNLKSLLLPSFHPSCQTNPSSSLQPDSDRQQQHSFLLSCERTSHISCSTTLPPTERYVPVPTACTLPLTNHNPSCSMQSLTLTTCQPFPIPGFEEPMSKSLKAGDLLLRLQ